MTLYAFSLLFTLCSLFILPLIIQTLSGIVIIPRMWLGMPLVLLFLFAVNTAKKSAINKNERYQLIVVLLVFIFGLYHGLTNSNTQLVGVLAYARTFWIRSEEHTSELQSPD